MLNINKFKSAVQKYDLERPNLFVVEFGIPQLFTTNKNNFDFSKIKEYVDGGRMLSLFCRSANIPGRGLGVAETKRHGIGPSIKMPHSGNFEDLTLTFYNDGDSRAYLFFHVWMEYIYKMGAGASAERIPGDDANWQLRFKKEYETTLDVITLAGEEGKFTGSGIASSIVSIASAKFGVPFVGSLLNSIGGPEYDLIEKRRFNFRKVFPTYLSGINYNHSSSDTVTDFSVTFTFQNFSSTYKMS